MSFSDRLDALLKERKLTRKQFSEEIGIGKNQITYWEKNETAPNKTTLQVIAQYFGVTPDYLLGIDTLKEKSMAALDNPTLILTADEIWFIQKLRELDKEGRTMVESTLIAETRRVATAKGESANAG